jgi:nucleoside-diphosphate kinase
MSSEQFLIILKPDAHARGLIGKLISIFEKKGFFLQRMRLIDPIKYEKIVREHYIDHQFTSFYSKLIEFTLSGQICIMIWEGNIQVARKMVGSTLPWEADFGTIRGDFACSLPANLIHCSDSTESARREIDIWKDVL